MNVIFCCIWELLVWLELPYSFRHITVSVALTIRSLPIELVRSSLFWMHIFQSLFLWTSC